MKWDKDKVFRTTKCFSPRTNGYAGGFPVGFLKWVQNNGWKGENRCYLCAGKVDDPESIRVDLNPETNPTHLEDARKTSLKDESFDWIMIDPPYSKELSKKLYGLEKYYSSINQFAKEAERLCKPNGLILTLSYEVPKRIKNCDFIAVCGIYQTISVAHMRCFTVAKKRGKEK